MINARKKLILKNGCTIFVMTLININVINSKNINMKLDKNRI